MIKMWLLISQKNVKSEFGNYIDTLENSYMDYFESLGFKLITIPNSSKNVHEYIKDLPISGIILSGSNDVNPELYGQEPIYAKNFSKIRDEKESLLLKMAIEKRLPVFCICRGMQFLNVYFGGSLIQNIEKELNISTHIKVIHKVEITDKKFYNLLNKKEFQVNSYHGQGITEKTLSKKLKVFAISKEDKIIEGIYHPDYPIIGIQWHPEREGSDKEMNKLLIDALLNKKIFWR